MTTMKEQIIQEIRHMPRDKTIRTVEVLENGDRNHMTFKCPQESLMMILNNMFDNNLVGNVPGGMHTQIIGWDIIDMPESVVMEGES